MGRVELECDPDLQMRFDGRALEASRLIAPAADRGSGGSIEDVRRLRVDHDNVGDFSFGRDCEAHIDQAFDSAAFGLWRIVGGDTLNEFGLGAWRWRWGERY